MLEDKEEKLEAKSKECLPKLSTSIRGLDKVLYGGIDANILNSICINKVNADRTPLVIVVKGSEGDNDKCMLAMQMLYGIAQSIEKVKAQYQMFGKGWNNTPVMYSTYYQKHKLDDLFLDFFISSSLQEFQRKKVSKDTSVNFSSNIFSSLLFDCSQILCKNIATNANIPYAAVANKTDELLGDGIIYYNRRTNSLHVKTSLNAGDDKYNQLYCRRENTINDYCNRSFCQKQQDDLFYQYTGIHVLPFDMVDVKRPWSIPTIVDPDKKLVAVDVSNEKNLTRHTVGKILDGLQNASIAILCVNSSADVPENRANMIIELSQKIDHRFVLSYLQIVKSDCQEFYQGQHQYKKREFGIEVYPRKELYLHERRYLQRALVYTHSDAVTETYLQYMKLQKYYIDSPTMTTYEEYEEDLKKNKPFFSLYPQNYMEMMSIDLLNKIFIPVNPLRHLLHKSQEEDDFIENEYMYGNAGFVTAVVGRANTYKRFLTFGGIFGSACAKDHTLIIMMNKEESVTRRRLICPARPADPKKMGACRNCYHYIHFMNICMGNITPEEFLYYLEKQIEVPYDDNQQKKIRRIVIDDLQILDFCFPRLEGNGLFLAALAELCRQHDIILYVLCDPKSQLYPTLHALADNVIFTKKSDEDGHPLIFVEKFAGYTNTPSKMYCGKVKNVNKLFRCVEDYDNNGFNKFEFQSNIVELEDMDEKAFYNLD